MLRFLSTLSLRRATKRLRQKLAEAIISIHALLAESDAGTDSPNCRPAYFYPRSPCGERQERPGQKARPNCHFYPRSPCGERLNDDGTIQAASVISIHALLAESDNEITYQREIHQYFYPRSPCGERPVLLILPIRKPGFLSTLSLRRATALIHSKHSKF